MMNETELRERTAGYFDDLEDVNIIQLSVGSRPYTGNPEEKICGMYEENGEFVVWEQMVNNYTTKSEDFSCNILEHRFPGLEEACRFLHGRASVSINFKRKLLAAYDASIKQPLTINQLQQLLEKEKVENTFLAIGCAVRGDDGGRLEGVGKINDRWVWTRAFERSSSYTVHVVFENEAHACQYVYNHFIRTFFVKAVLEY